MIYNELKAAKAEELAPYLERGGCRSSGGVSAAVLVQCGAKARLVACAGAR